MNDDVVQIMYTPKEVMFLLGYYLEYRSNLLSPTAIPEDPCIRSGYVTDNQWKHELPLGHSKSDPPWPYMVKSPAHSRVDGKRRAMKAQDIHISMVDLEHGLACLTDNYLEVLYKYYLFQTHTYEDIAKEHGLSHRFMIQRRCNKALETLTAHMNAGGRRVG